MSVLCALDEFALRRKTQLKVKGRIKSVVERGKGTAEK